MPLFKGLSDYWAAQQNNAKAREAAQRLCECAAEPFERTWLASGHLQLAELALAEQFWGEAEAELSKALARVQEVEAPLAAWRVYTRAAAFHQGHGRTAEAEFFWERSAKIIRQLADSLDETDCLRRSWLNAAPVRAVLDRTPLA